MILRLILYLTFALLTTRATRRSTRSKITMPTDTHDIDILSDLGDNSNHGDVANSDENPVLDVEPDGFAGIDVLVNMRLARTPNGHHAIAIYCPENVTLTASQAHHLHIDLETASRVVADIRRDAGYGS